MPLDGIGHLYCCVEYSVLTTQLSQHYTYKSKHHFRRLHNYTGHTWTKTAARKGKNSHESETLPTTNSILTQRQLSCW